MELGISEKEKRERERERRERGELRGRSRFQPSRGDFQASEFRTGVPLVSPFVFREPTSRCTVW